MPAPAVPYDRVTPPELGLMVLVFAPLLGAPLLTKAIEPSLVNAALGIAGWRGYGVVGTPIVVLIVAFGGGPRPSSFLLAYLDALSEPALILPLF